MWDFVRVDELGRTGLGCRNGACLQNANSVSRETESCRAELGCPCKCALVVGIWEAYTGGLLEELWGVLA